MSKLVRFAAACVAVVCAFGVSAAPERRVKMHVAEFSGYYELENFPLLVRISPERIEGFSYDDCKANGADLSFTLEDGTLLAHEVDTWNPQGESVVWVSLPKFGQQASFYFRWKDAAPPAVDSTAVWTKAGYVGVWHFNEERGDALDSSGNRYTAKLQGAKADSCVAVPGAFGMARQMATASDTGAKQVYFTVPDVPKSVFEQPFTLSFWGNIASANASEYVFTDKSTATDDGFGIYGNGTYNSKFEYMLLCNGKDTTKISQMPGSVINGWANYDFYWDGTKVGLNYLGVARTTRTGAMTPAVDGFAFGSTMNGSAKAFQGKADEMRLRTNVTTLNWSLAELEQMQKTNFVVADSAAEVIKQGVRVTSSAMEFSDGANPVYGEFEMTAGATHTFIAPPEAIAQNGAVTATCAGWTLSKVSDGSVVRTSENPAVGEDATTCIVTYSEPMVLTWQWSTALNPGFAVTYYVSPSGSGADGLSWKSAFKHPQDAIDAAAGTVESPAVVLVGDGSYPERTDAANHIHAAIHIAKSHVTVKSVNGPATTVLDGTRTSASDPNYAYRGIGIAAGLSDVLVCGFSVVNGSKQADSYSSGNNYWLAATSVGAMSGVLSNLVITVYDRNRCHPVHLGGTSVLVDSIVTTEATTRNNGYPNQHDNRLLAICDTAMVDRCVIRDVSPFSTSTMQGAVQPIGLYSAGSVLRNCLVTGCTTGADGVSMTAGGGTVWATAGTVENCTIAGNTVYYPGGGLHIAGSDVVCRNNVIFGNTDTTGQRNDIAVASGKTPTVEYCCSSDVTTGENGNVNGDPGFTDAANGDYSLSVDSLVAGKGEILGWMKNDPVDLVGGKRIWTDGTVTPGAYEPQGRSQKVTGDFSIRSGVWFGAAPFAVTFDATLSGASDDVAYSWDFGDEGSSTEASPTHSYARPGLYTVTLTVNDPGKDPLVVTKTDLVAVRGEACYVKAGNVGTKPYDTWEKAAGTIEEALVLKPTRVVVTNGTYRLSGVNGIELTWGVTVESVEGPDETVVWSLVGDTPIGVGGKFAWAADTTSRNLTMTHPDAVVLGLTFAKAFNTAIYATGGRIENCRLADYRGAHQNPTVRLTDATAVDCTFDFGHASVTDQNVFDNACGVVLSGTALMDRCKVRDYNSTLDKVAQDRVWTIGAVRLNGQAGIRNSYVTGTTYSIPRLVDFTAAGVIVAGDGNEVVNCTIAGNSVVNGTDPAQNVIGGGLCVKGSNAAIVNTIIWGNMVNGANHDLYVASGSAVLSNNIVRLVAELPDGAVDCIGDADPRFADDGAGYRITKDSPCYNAGCKVGWAFKKGMATDIDGQERRCGPIDIGCWELQRPLGLTLMVW